MGRQMRISRDPMILCQLVLSMNGLYCGRCASRSNKLRKQAMLHWGIPRWPLRQNGCLTSV